MDPKRFLSLSRHYENTERIMFRCSIWISVLLFVFLILNKCWFKIGISGMQFFFILCSLISFCALIIRYINFDTILKLSYEKPEIVDGELVNNDYKGCLKWMEKKKQSLKVTTVLFITGALCIIAIIFISFLPGCEEEGEQQCKETSQTSCSGKVEVDLLQINDVYEISPLDSGRIGGMARIAALKRKFLQQNKNTMLLMAGDFISPSVFNSVKHDSTPVYGEQMVNLMNVAGVDLTIFGNHEFDVKFETLQKRINESWFGWVASNVRHVSGSDTSVFTKNNIPLPEETIISFKGTDGTLFRIGFFGITTNDNVGDPVFAKIDSAYVDVARKKYNKLSPNCDAVIAITHLDIKDDEKIAQQVPELLAIIGGHEHDMRYEKIGKVYITKAHANAKSAFHLKIEYVKKNGSKVITVTPELICINTSIEEDCLAKSICNKWMDMAMQFFEDSGFAPHSIIRDGFNVKLDGRDASVRSKATNLTKIITDAMVAAGKEKEKGRPNGSHWIAMFNSGSIRVDDIIVPPIDQYAMLRALPYGGPIYIAKMKGSIIKQIARLAAGFPGDGDFLQYSDNLNVSTLTIDSIPIDDKDSFNVVITEYLIDGKQKKLKHIINRQNPEILSVSDKPLSTDTGMYDIRKAVIRFLKNDKTGLKKYN